MSSPVSRRGFLAGMAAIGAGTVLRGTPSAADELTATPASTSAGAASAGFRFVHLTDIHVQPEREGEKGLTAALKAVEALRPKPDFILTGGDNVFDAFDTGEQRSRMLFGLFRKIMADHTDIPVHVTIGNHDVFGWGNKDGVTPSTLGYGRAMAQEYLGLKETHYAFTHKGYRFVVLDNIQPGVNRRGYEGYIDRPQRQWLEDELKKTGPQTPVVICEHIPLISVTPFAVEDNYKRSEHRWEMPSGLVCADAAERLALYSKYNVRLSLSGHLHQLDRVEYGKTTFVCDGAVCGAWWRGPHRGVPEGFGILDCDADGTIRHQYYAYGWQAKPDPADEKRS